MKRTFLGTLAMLIIVLAGALSPVLGFFADGLYPATAHAQLLNPTTTTTDSTTTPSTSGTTFYGPGGDPNNSGAGEERDPNKSPVPDPDKLDCGSNFICSGIVLFSYAFQFLPNLFAQVSGMVLDYTVWKNLQSDTWTTQDQADSFVVKGWRVVRDFSNIFFIFALFTVAFTLILSGAGSDRQPLFGLDPKRTIARVILMALLINFSFFMCRVVIDITNLFGNVFYQKITIIDTGGGRTACSDTSGGGFGGTECFYSQYGGIRSISLGILSSINPQQLMLNAGANIGNAENTSGTVASAVTGWKSYDVGVYMTLLFISAMVGIFDFFLIYLFISSAIFLSARIFGLFFLIILSPIAFVSTAIPALQSKEYFGFDDWFKQLIGLAFCLPIYLFFLWLAIFFLKVGGADPTVKGAVAVSAIIIIKMFAVGFVLIIGKKVSKDLSGKFGAMATNAVTSLATGAVMIAGAAMTGGTSAALQMGGRLAGQAAASTARGVGGAILGDEKAQQLEKWIRTPGNTMKRLNNFNPIRDMAGKTGSEAIGQFGRNIIAATGEAARFSGSKMPDELAAAFRTGKLTPRLEDIKKAAELAKKAKLAKAESDKQKTKEVDKEIADLKKEKEDGLKTNKEYEADMKKLALKKKNILNPSATEIAAVNDASGKLDEAKKKLPEKNKKLDEAVMNGQKKLISLNDQLAKNATNLASTTQKIADIEAKELDAQKNAADKRSAIKSAETLHDETIRNLTDKREQAQENIKPITAQIATLDKQYDLLEKFGSDKDKWELEGLRTARSALIKKEREAKDRFVEADSAVKSENKSYDTAISAMNAELDSIIAQQNSLAAEHQKELAKRSELNKDTTKTYDSVASTKAQLDADIAARISSDVTLNQLEANVSKAKDDLKIAQEKTWVAGEISKRTRFEQKDLTNRAGNADRVEKLNTYLQNIATGGAKAIDPNAKRQDF